MTERTHFRDTTTLLSGNQFTLTSTSFPDSRTDPPQAICKALESTGGGVITTMTWWTTNHVSPIIFPLIALYNKWREQIVMYLCQLHKGFLTMSWDTQKQSKVKYQLEHKLWEIVVCSLFRYYSCSDVYQGYYLSISLGNIFINDSKH